MLNLPERIFWLDHRGGEVGAFKDDTWSGAYTFQGTSGIQGGHVTRNEALRWARKQIDGLREMEKGKWLD
jgi:hypothetical protein